MNNEKYNKVTDLPDDLPDGLTYATTAELMMMFGKSIDEALDIHNELERIVKNKENNK